MTAVAFDGVAWSAGPAPVAQVWPCPYCHEDMAGPLVECTEPECVTASLVEDRRFDFASPV